MTSTYSKVKTISEDLKLSESSVAMVLYNYLTWCCQEILLDGESNTIFGKLKLDEENRIYLEKTKFGLIELLDKRDLKLIRKIVEDGPDTTIF